MTRLEEEFSHWAEAVGYNEFTNEVQKVMMRMAFYSGTMIGWSVTHDCIDDDDNEKCYDQLCKLHEELHDKLTACSAALKHIEKVEH